MNAKAQVTGAEDSVSKSESDATTTAWRISAMVIAGVVTTGVTM